MADGLVQCEGCPTLLDESSCYRDVEGCPLCDDCRAVASHAETCRCDDCIEEVAQLRIAAGIIHKIVEQFDIQPGAESVFVNVDGCGIFVRLNEDELTYFVRRLGDYGDSE